MNLQLRVSSRGVSLCTHNLQFDGFAIELNGADLEVHSDGTDVALCVGVILNRDYKFKNV